MENYRKRFATYQFEAGYTISFSPHSLQRIGQRGLSVEQILHLAHIYAQSKDGGMLTKGERMAIRSARDGMIFILAVNQVTDRKTFELTVVTVWNQKDGEFFHHPSDTVLEFSLTRSGPRFDLADESDIRRNRHDNRKRRFIS
jgi:hypothetical protein